MQFTKHCTHRSGEDGSASIPMTIRMVYIERMQRGKHHRIRTTAIVVVVVVLAALLCFLFPDGFTGLPTDKRHVTYEIDTSSRFTPSQLHDVAVQAVNDYNVTGCSIDSIRYDDAKSTQWIADDINPELGESTVGNTAKKYGAHNVVMLDLQYSCGKYVPSPQNPNESDTIHYFYLWRGHQWHYIASGRV